MTSGHFGGGGGGGGGWGGGACAPFAHPWIRAWVSPSVLLTHTKIINPLYTE